MTTFDTVLVAIIAGFGVVGFATGCIQAVGSLAGVAVGTIVATRSFSAVASLALPLFGGNEVAASIVCFIIIFLCTARAVGFVVHVIDKAFKILAIFPGLKTINRLAGFIIGIIEGVLTLGVIFNVASRLPLTDPSIALFEGSWIMQMLMRLSAWLIPLFPSVLERVTTTIH